MNNWLLAYLISIPVTYYWIKFLHFLTPDGNGDDEWDWTMVSISFAISLTSAAGFVVVTIACTRMLILRYTKGKRFFKDKPPKWL